MERAELHPPETGTEADEAPCPFGQDKCPSTPGPSACLSSGFPSDQPTREVLGMSQTEEKQRQTHLTFCLPPHLPEPHPYC